MPEEGLRWPARPDLLTGDEVVGLVRIAVIRLGVEEVRFTGGETLLRPGLVGIVERCVALASRPAVCMALTRRDRRHDVLKGLAAARAAGLTPVKVKAPRPPDAGWERALAEAWPGNAPERLVRAGIPVGDIGSKGMFRLAA